MMMIKRRTKEREREGKQKKNKKNEERLSAAVTVPVTDSRRAHATQRECFRLLRRPHRSLNILIKRATSVSLKKNSKKKDLICLITFL